MNQAKDLTIEQDHAERSNYYMVCERIILNEKLAHGPGLIKGYILIQKSNAANKVPLLCSFLRSPLGQFKGWSS
jgi:hypothetical protein